jgi:membrane fusion protein (multidrug efflux system)
MSGELVEVRKGLNEGDQVVTAGKITLRDGASVEVLNPPAGAVATDVAQVAQAGNGTSN